MPAIITQSGTKPTGSIAALRQVFLGEKFILCPGEVVGNMFERVVVPEQWRNIL
jgi:hypothetical protein